MGQDLHNMGNDLAVFVTWGAFLVDGTHLMNIGEKSTATGTDPPVPAIVGGLNTHSVFEGENLFVGMTIENCVHVSDAGDARTTRGDFYFGDNFTFNATLSIRCLYFVLPRLIRRAHGHTPTACYNVQKVREWNL
jgi:unspecific peroxygenase